MGILGDTGIALLGVLIVYFARLEWALWALIAAWLLIPSALIVPDGPHILLINRLILYVFAFRLLRRAGQPGEPKRGAYRVSGLHAMLLLLVLVAYTNGVLLPPSTSFLASNLHGFLEYIDLAILF